MNKEIYFKIDGHELFLDFMLEEYEFDPVFYICRDGQNRKYAVWCIDFDKEAYAIVRVPLILLNDMLHGLISIRDFFLSRNAFWKVRCMDDSCEDDRVEKFGMEDFPAETLPDEGFVYKSFDAPHRDYVERIEKELQGQYNNIPVSPVADKNFDESGRTQSVEHIVFTRVIGEYSGKIKYHALTYSVRSDEGIAA